MGNSVSNAAISALRAEFTEYLKGLGRKAYSTTVSDAFFLYTKNPDDMFLEMLSISDFSVFCEVASSRLALSLADKPNPTEKANAYLSPLKQLWRFYHPEYQPAAKSGKQAMSEDDITLPRPSSEEAARYLAKWEEATDLAATERVLHTLFTETHPTNTVLDEIILKVAVLNTIYSTHIYAVYPVAKHILDLDIDSRLKAGDVSLVSDIMRTSYGDGKQIDHYSFASKYCSFHNPDAFPIYDSYVDKLMRYYRDKDGFAKFRNTALKDYSVFTQILSSFRMYYGLEHLSTKQLDQYLWLLGKEFL